MKTYTLEEMEAKKKVMVKELAVVEADIVQLQRNIQKFREDLEKVNLETDLRSFDDDHDLENGLIHIRLF